MINSLFHNIVQKASNKLSGRNETLNGPDPRFVSYRENGKDKKIENLNLDSAHCHIFIGKMKVDGSGTYSDEVIIALLKHFFDHTKKGEKVVIELANKVSELLNGEESMEGNMKFTEQQQHILELAKDLNKSRVKDLEIVDIQDTNKRLFEVLEHEGLKGLDGGASFLDLEHNFDSLDIAKLLYAVAKQDTTYLEEIKNLKSEEFRQISGDSDYYGLIEMAIRINALLHGITLQGGVARQKKYDALLLKHINPYVKDFPLLDEFKKKCWEKLRGEYFQGLYFDTEGSEKLVHKLDAKKQLESKTKNALLLALGLSIGVGATSLGGAYFQTQKQKKATQETIKEIFENKKVGEWGDMFGKNYEGDEAVEHIEKDYVDQFVFAYTTRYGKIKGMSELEFRYKVISCLNNQNILNMLANVDGRDTYINLILDEIFIPQYIGELKYNRMNTIPYTQYAEYEEGFAHMLEADSSLFDSNRRLDPEVARNDINGHKKVAYYRVEEIGNFITFNQNEITNKYTFLGSGMIYKLGIKTDYDKEGRETKYVVSKGPYVKRFLNETDTNKDQWDLQSSKKVALNYFLQTKPIITSILNEYILRYAGFIEHKNNAKHIPHQDMPIRNVCLRDDIQEIFIKDIVKNKIYEKIKVGEFDKINQYLDNFVQKNKDELIVHGAKTTPYGFYKKNLNVIQNTLKNGSHIEKHWIDIPKDNDAYFTSNMGYYRSSDGGLHQLIKAKVNGQDYLYASSISEIYYEGQENSFGLEHGIDMAKDLMRTFSQTK